ncbi:MAG: tetratricopeptide repeat protein [Spirochaetaceae bacterium]|jgi:tetratricopeptide (TPR) repeat protein|nr:tetratricopeptide repeat protein [Spirochaetaceae bacterium]
MEKTEKTEIQAVENKTVSIYGFVEKNRKALLISFVVILVLAAGLIAALIVNDISRKNTIAKLDILIERYDKVKQSLSSAVDTVDAGGIEGADDTGDVETLLGDLRAFGESASGYPAARAWFMAGNIYHERKEWQEAQAAWLAAAEKGAKTHLAPVCLFNAAVASEEAGDTDAALENYRKSIDFVDFPAAAHAQFSVGRLEEKQGDNEAAIAAYRAIIEKWPADTEWTNLAHSRILALELRESE